MWRSPTVRTALGIHTCSRTQLLPGLASSPAISSRVTGLSTRWTAHPSTVIAGIGRDGQRFSHAPQPTHLTASTTGIPFTSTIAFTGQWRSHAVHTMPFWAAMHRSLCQIARPICVRSFSPRGTGDSAPAGQSFEHREQRGWQYPCSNPISGSIKRLGSLDGRRTFDGHDFTHN